MPKISKYALIFKNRMLSFDQDLELIDIICTANNKHDFLPSDTLLFSNLDTKKHPSLQTRSVTDTNRKIVVLHLRATVYSSYIKDLYEELSSYIKNVLYEAARLAKDSSTAKRLLGEHKITLNASDILTYSDINALAQRIAGDILKALENERSTKNLIKKLCEKLDISIEDSIAEQAMPYLELRHRLVHTDGKVDEDFKQKYTCFSYDDENYVVINYRTIKKAKKRVSDLVLAIDKSAISKNILVSP